MRSGHRKGRGIHPPFAFELVSRVIYDGDCMAMPEAALRYRNSLHDSSKIIRLQNHGAGSRITKSALRKVSAIAKSSSVKLKQGMFLYRLVKWYQPSMIVELGTGIGISTAFLASGSQEAALITVDGDPIKSALAQDELGAAGFSHITFHQSTFGVVMPEIMEKLESRCLFFIDGDHRFEATVNTVKRILGKGHEEVIIVLDDIYWSDEMEKAWRLLSADERIVIAIDLFFMGILVCRPGIEKQHFNVTF